MKERINSYKDLRVFQNALTSAIRVFELTEKIPVEDRFALAEPMRRSSRSVCSNIARAWRKRQFKTPFVAVLKESESEACETQVWIEFAKQCRYLDEDACTDLDAAYDQIVGQLSKMTSQPDKWLIKPSPGQEMKNGGRGLGRPFQDKQRVPSAA